MKHTKGPWRVVSDIDSESQDGWPIVAYRDQSIFSPPMPNDELAYSGDDAARIVACVNACEGIEDPSVVPEMLAALKQLTADISRSVDISIDWSGSAISMIIEGGSLRALIEVIARAEGTSK
jgi:hypothetical protein